MGTHRDLKTVSYNGQRDGVMMGRGAGRFVLSNNRQTILHWREERDAECCTYTVRLRRDPERNQLPDESRGSIETNSWFVSDVRGNSNTRTQWFPNKDIGKN